MQQNIKRLLLLIFLIVFSFVSFQYFDDDVETVSIPSTTSTTTTTVAVVKIEPYKVPAFNLEEIISSSLEKIDIVCERTGNWFSLTSSCLEQWNNAYIAITENKAFYYEHYEYSRTYFIENYKYLEKDDIEVIISSFCVRTSCWHTSDTSWHVHLMIFLPCYEVMLQSLCNLHLHVSHVLVCSCPSFYRLRSSHRTLQILPL